MKAVRSRLHRALRSRSVSPLSMCWPFKSGVNPLLLLLALGACGGGTTFDGTTVRGPNVAYTVGRPGDAWSQLEVSDNHVAWQQDQTTSSIIQVNGRCDDALDIPLQALRAHLLVGFTERAFRSEQIVELDGREALRTQVAAKLDGVARELDLVVLKKDGCVYDFSLIAADQNHFESAQGAFERVLAGFRSEP